MNDDNNNNNNTKTPADCNDAIDDYDYDNNNNDYYYYSRVVFCGITAWSQRAPNNDWRPVRFTGCRCRVALRARRSAHRVAHGRPFPPVRRAIYEMCPPPSTVTACRRARCDLAKRRAACTGTDQYVLLTGESLANANKHQDCLFKRFCPYFNRRPRNTNSSSSLLRAKPSRLPFSARHTVEAFIAGFFADTSRKRHRQSDVFVSCTIRRSSSRRVETVRESSRACTSSVPTPEPV